MRQKKTNRAKHDSQRKHRMPKNIHRHSQRKTHKSSQNAQINPPKILKISPRVDPKNQTKRLHGRHPLHAPQPKLESRQESLRIPTQKLRGTPQHRRSRTSNHPRLSPYLITHLPQITKLERSSQIHLCIQKERWRVLSSRQKSHGQIHPHPPKAVTNAKIGKKEKLRALERLRKYVPPDNKIR
jgi:hypothetical protein